MLYFGYSERSKSFQYQETASHFDITDTGELLQGGARQITPLD